MCQSKLIGSCRVFLTIVLFAMRAVFLPKAGYPPPNFDQICKRTHTPHLPTVTVPQKRGLLVSPELLRDNVVSDQARSRADFSKKCGSSRY